MKKIAIIAALLATFAAAAAQDKGKINWVGFETAMEQHEKTGKPVFIDVYTDWCGYCKKMDKETLENKAVADYINTHFIAVKLNAETSETISYKGQVYKNERIALNERSKSHSLAELLLNGRMAYPTVVYMVPSKDIVAPIPGFATPETIEPYLMFFAEKVYEGNLFDAFNKGLNVKRIR
jgi:thioredoxin-related protein